MFTTYRELGCAGLCQCEWSAVIGVWAKVASVEDSTHHGMGMVIVFCPIALVGARWWQLLQYLHIYIM